FFFFSSRRRHTRSKRDWSSDVCSSDLTPPPDRAGFERELASRMEQPREEDPEQQVEALRQFQRAALFRVAVADLTGALPLMQVSDRLTDIAELIVERALDPGWRQITAQFGPPRCGD